jgi:hypothetical protein
MIPNHMTVINQPYDNSLDKLIERRKEEKLGDAKQFYERFITTRLFLVHSPRHVASLLHNTSHAIEKMHSICGRFLLNVMQYVTVLYLRFPQRCS